MMWKAIKSGFSGKRKKNASIYAASDKGLVIFNVVEDAIKAEKIIINAGNECKLVAPPPFLRKGCDLALEINLLEQAVIERVLQTKVIYTGVYPLKGTAELLHVVKVKQYGRHIMVKAGNMKIVFDKTDGMIVNTSGGGCPDIPYLNLQLVGKRLTEAPRPRDIGFTLCALMLDRAFEEALNLWKGRDCNAVDCRDCT